MILKFYKKLNYLNLGFNLSFNLNKNKFWVSKYKKYIAFSNVTFSVMSGFYFFGNFKKFSKILNSFLKLKSLFIFVSLNKDMFTMTGVYKFIQKSIYTYFVYDWIFGAVSNYRRIFETYSLRQKSLIKNIPEIGVLLETKGWTHIIINELKARNAFSIGFINPVTVKHLDFPLPLTDKFESSFFLTNFFIKFINLKFLNV